MHLFAQLLGKVQNAEVCDATKFNSVIQQGSKKIDLFF